MEKEYLSIKEFATAVGISQQAVYKQLNNKLKEYLKVVDGKKMLDIKALELYKTNDDSTKNSTSCTTDEQQLINWLKEEIKEKNKQIALLQAQIEKEQQLLNQEQQLRMVEQQKYLELQSKYEEQDNQEPVNVVEEEPKKKGFFSRLFFGN